MLLRRSWCQLCQRLFPPLFTDLLRALGLAYGNDLAANIVVEAKAAALFVGIASTGKGVRVFRHATNG